jgi:hypothetical protein
VAGGAACHRKRATRRALGSLRGNLRAVKANLNVKGDKLFELLALAGGASFKFPEERVR